jgi:hypothetical protein
MADESSRKRLPFEPGGNRKADAPGSAAAKTSGKKPAKPKPTQAAQPQRASAKLTQGSGIPEAVSGRMLRRMITFSGVPTLMGVATFFVSYFLLVNQVLELPSYFVLLTTLGCFGLGVVGLSYGALSASWDEDRPGHWLGLEEFKVNFGRLTGSWGSRSGN